MVASLNRMVAIMKSRDFTHHLLALEMRPSLTKLIATHTACCRRAQYSTHANLRPTWLRAPREKNLTSSSCLIRRRKTWPIKMWMGRVAGRAEKQRDEPSVR